MTNKEKQFVLQDQRCWLCQRKTMISQMTIAHLTPKSHGGIIGDDWSGAVLMHPDCNSAMKCLHAGSLRFQKWIKRVVKHGSLHHFIRRETFVHNAT
jgi:hypothetical protein